MRHLQLLFTALFTVLPLLASGDVTVERLDEPKGRFATALISGEILKSDAARFKELVGLLRPAYEVFEVELNSPGGDVAAALEIAHVVRSEGMWTSVEGRPSVLCASACVYIFAAGVVRIAGDRARILIHRPYADPEKFGRMDRKSAEQRYGEVAEKIRSFLSSMGMSDSLFSQMMKVPSHKGRRLTYAELETMNLVGHDPAYMEWQRARNVVRFGEARMRGHDEWLKRSEAHYAKCLKRRDDVEEWRRCGKLLDAIDPNPLRPSLRN